MTRTIYRTALLVMVSALCVATASADLIGTPVTGSLVVFGPNLFDPANGQVPAGYLNAAGTTVTVAEPAIEFGFLDPGNNMDTANFTGNQLIVTDTVFDAAAAWTMTFTDPAFTSLAKVSDSFTNGGVTGTLVGDTITVTWAGTGTTDGLLTATFNVGSAATPEPSSLVLCGLGAVGLFLAARRRRKA